MKKRLLSTMLALCLVLTMLPLNALATDEPPVETETGAELQEEEATTPENPTPLTPIEVTEDEQTTTPDSGGTSELGNPSEDATNSQLSGSDSGNEQDEPMILSETKESARTSITDPGLTASGTCGDNATWTLNTYTGVLTISGTGRIAGDRQWNAYETIVKTIVIQDGITSIGEWTFNGFKNLTDITIPNSVATIEKGAFASCTSVTNITIPNSVVSIEQAAFSGCLSLSSIDIPDSVTNLEMQAFSECRNLTSATLPKGITTIERSVFANCENLVNVTIPNGVVTIRAGAFSYCGFESIDIPDSVTKIEGDAFTFCRHLKSIVIPNSVIEIENTSAGSGAFWECAGLISVILSENLTELQKSLFKGCSQLANVYIPKNVANIGVAAFADCDKLSDIYYGGSEDEWNAIAIGLSNEALEKATIHYNSKPEDVPMPSEDGNKKLTFYTWTAGGIEREISWNWDLFTGSSTEYNNTLAKTGLILSAAAENSQGAAESELKKLGFQTVNSKNFDTEWFGTFQPGVTFGHKVATTSNGTRHIFAIVVRGTSSVADIRTDILSVYDRFNISATLIGAQFNDFIQNTCGLNLNGIKSNTSIFVTGHSLGGAVANIVAKNLNTTTAYGEKNIFAYTFASPLTANILEKLLEISRNRNILNVINANDIVTTLPPGAQHRYGQEKWKFSKADIYSSAFSARYKELTGQNFDEGTPFFRNHAVETYMTYILGHDANQSTSTISRLISALLCRIKCPVDVEVYSSDNQLLGRVVNNVAENIVPEKAYIHVDGDVKYLCLMNDDDYTLKFTGTDTGIMEYTVQGFNLDESTMVNEKIFANVTLAKDKKMSSKVSLWDKNDNAIDTDDKIDVSEVQLFMTDEDGNAIKEILPDGNGTEVYISRTVTFNANGGTVNPTTMTTGTNGKLSSLPTPTRNGYRFRGWYTAANGGTQITTDTIFTSDSTVYAQWGKANSNGSSENTGSGSGDNNGGSGSSTNSNGNLTSNGNQNNSGSSGANNIASANKSPATGDTTSIVWLRLLEVLAILAFIYMVLKRRGYDIDWLKHK